MNRFVHACLAVLVPATLVAQSTLSVTVFEDRNGNGARDAGERAIPRVVISNQRDVATTDASGVARIERGPTGIVFVSVPDGYRSVGAFWRAPAPADSQLTVRAAVRSGAAHLQLRSRVRSSHRAEQRRSHAALPPTRRFDPARLHHRHR